MGVPQSVSTAFDVLVADDDADIRDLLGEFFRDRGLRVAVAHDGRSAIAALEQSKGRYRLVVTDITMPGADGFAVLSAARTACTDAYVVMMTGFATLDSAVRAVRLGAQDYLTKPFLLGQLDVIVDRAITRLSTVQTPTSNTGPAVHAVAGLEARLSEIDGRLSSVERGVDQLLALMTLSR
jgi:DNA-binding NtrC family response regulator